MQPLRNALRGNVAAGPSRTALNAVATRVQEATGLEAEKWVATDVEDAGSPMFSEPLTIDELQAAREDFETSFRGPDGAPAILDDGTSSTASDETSASSTISIDANHQMQQIHHGTVGSRQSVSEFLDAAVLAARNQSVQQAVVAALLKSPDAMAALQRGLAHEGITLNAHSLQRAALLPPAAAVATTHIEEIPADDDSGQGGQGGLKDAFDKMMEEVVSNLGKFGGRVLSVLEGVGKRWKRRIESLFNLGAAAKRGGAGGPREEDHDPLLNIVDGIVSAAALIITVALFKRVPLLR